MENIKVLWFSNRIFESTEDKKSGTWLTALGPSLVDTGKITLANISIGHVNEITKADCRNIKQWLIPYQKIGKNGVPSTPIITGIQEICNEFKPDIIHVWGTENYWGLLTARNYLTGNVVLSMQGILASIVPVFYGGLTFSDRLKCLGLRELIFPEQSIFREKKKMRSRINVEKEIIKGHQYIISQSEWVKFQVENLNQNVISFHTERALREEFINCKKWTELHKTSSTSPIVFTTSLSVPYKGLHVLIKTIAVLKKKFPSIKLIVGGHFIKNGIKQSGYDKWLFKLITTWNVENNIIFVGSLNAEKLVQYLGQSDVFINPSFVESYSLTVAEAMSVGTPTVVSFAGAMPELLGDDETALYFSPGDHMACARQISRFLGDFEFSNKASLRIQAISVQRNDLSIIVLNQLKIYQNIIESNNKSNS